MARTPSEMIGGFFFPKELMQYPERHSHEVNKKAETLLAIRILADIDENYISSARAMPLRYDCGP